MFSQTCPEICFPGDCGSYQVDDINTAQYTMELVTYDHNWL